MQLTAWQAHSPFFIMHWGSTAARATEDSTAKPRGGVASAEIETVAMLKTPV